MLYVEVEREADWPLHLHVNYAHYGLYNLKSMEQLPKDVTERFLKGEHVIYHNTGLWNGIWSDMYIETTSVRHGN